MFNMNNEYDCNLKGQLVKENICESGRLEYYLLKWIDNMLTTSKYDKMYLEYKHYPKDNLLR